MLDSIIQVSITKILHFFDTNRIWIFDNIFVSETIQVYIP